MLHTIYFIYGLCVMFYLMMSWLFFHKDKELLSRLIAVLMLVIGVQCLKNLCFIKPITDINEIKWMMTIASDVIIIPLYAFILIELCSPTSLTRRTIIVHELLFIAPFVLFIITRNVLFYYAEVVETFAYGLYFTIWGVIAISRYNRELKQRFSYTENINLNWLRAIFLSFVFILILWIANSMYANYIIEALYMTISLVVWIFINYYIYKHESVLDELSDNQYTDVQDAITSDRKDSYIRKHITDLFENEKIYLNPNLKVSDIAAAIGTNRTYISAYFNKETQCTFYDHVNRYRIEYACKLLENSDEKILQIAELSGFNSSQAFIRVFIKIKGISPNKYRKEKNR